MISIRGWGIGTLFIWHTTQRHRVSEIEMGSDGGVYYRVIERWSVLAII